MVAQYLCPQQILQPLSPGKILWHCMQAELRKYDDTWGMGQNMLKNYQPKTID